MAKSEEAAARSRFTKNRNVSLLLCNYWTILGHCEALQTLRSRNIDFRDNRKRNFVCFGDNTGLDNLPLINW